jgi:hypothetical protein
VELAAAAATPALPAAPELPPIPVAPTAETPGTAPLDLPTVRELLGLPSIELGVGGGQPAAEAPPVVQPGVVTEGGVTPPVGLEAATGLGQPPAEAIVAGQPGATAQVPPSTIAATVTPAEAPEAGGAQEVSSIGPATGPLADLIAALGSTGLLSAGAAASTAPPAISEASPGPSSEVAPQLAFGTGTVFGPAFATAETTGPAEPEPAPAAAVGAQVAFPPGLFGAGPREAWGEVPEEGITRISGTELAAAAQPVEAADQEQDQDRIAGPRHVHDRELIGAVERRMLEERERMGGFGALIR